MCSALPWLSIRQLPVQLSLSKPISRQTRLNWSSARWHATAHSLTKFTRPQSQKIKTNSIVSRQQSALFSIGADLGAPARRTWRHRGACISAKCFRFAVACIVAFTGFSSAAVQGGDVYATSTPSTSTPPPIRTCRLEDVHSYTRLLYVPLTCAVIDGRRGALWVVTPCAVCDSADVHTRGMRLAAAALCGGGGKSFSIVHPKEQGAGCPPADGAPWRTLGKSGRSVRVVGR
jgi:hypothetical protein